MKSTAETMQEVEAKKRQLEEHVSIQNCNILSCTNLIKLFVNLHSSKASWL